MPHAYSDEMAHHREMTHSFDLPSHMMSPPRLPGPSSLSPLRRPPDADQIADLAHLCDEIAHHRAISEPSVFVIGSSPPPSRYI